MLFTVHFIDGYIYEVDAGEIKSHNCKILDSRNVATFIRPRFDRFTKDGLWCEIWETVLDNSTKNNNNITSIELRKGNSATVMQPTSHAITKFCIIDHRDIDRISRVYMDSQMIIWRHYFENGTSRLVNGLTAQLQIELYKGTGVTPSLYDSIFDSILQYEEYGKSLPEISEILSIDEDVLESVYKKYSMNNHSNTPEQKNDQATKSGETEEEENNLTSISDDIGTYL